MSLIAVRTFQNGPRVYVANRFRVHHGLVGVMLITGGVILILDDLPDFPWSPFEKGKLG